MTLTGRLVGEAATLALGRYLGRRAAPGGVILLTGELGAGKTVLAKGVARGLGLDPDAVTSPTYTLVAEHAGRLTMYHVDLYRLSGDTDFEAEGLLDLMGGDGLAVVEWAERLGEFRPAGALTVRLEPVDETIRRVTLIDDTGRWLEPSALAALVTDMQSAGVD
jgi:tRNA threonylcarbamoyladenosine biosynthesis protein TsaE